MYDAIIVGARCAGSPTAMLLARKGYRVLLVDKASFPSDTISTHIIWPHGAEIMDRWGLLDGLAATGCPPIALNMIFDVGPFALKGGVTDTNAGPRWVLPATYGAGQDCSSMRRSRAAPSCGRGSPWNSWSGPAIESPGSRVAAGQAAASRSGQES